jgi:hypothetical protein
MPREKLGEILIKAGLLDEMGLQRALNEQQRWGGQLGRYLVELGLISEETLVRALSTQYGLPAVALDPPKLSIAVGRLIPREISERYGLVCFRSDPKKKFLDIAVSDPASLDAIDEVRVATKFNVRPHIAAPSVIDRAMRFVYYGEVDGAEIELTPASPPQRVEARVPPPPPPAAHPPEARRPPPPSEGMPRHPPASVAIPAAPWTPGVTPLPSSAPPMPVLDVKVAVSEPSGPFITPSSFVPAIDESFHITLDVPAVDKEAIAQALPSVEDRLILLEATIARNTSILQRLMEALVARGLYSREEILKIISSR